MNFTTATGTRFSCGDGTGRPVRVKFLTEEAERRVLLNPELALGEVDAIKNIRQEKKSLARIQTIIKERATQSA